MKQSRKTFFMVLLISFFGPFLRISSILLQYFGIPKIIYIYQFLHLFFLVVVKFKRNIRSHLLSILEKLFSISRLTYKLFFGTRLLLVSWSSSVGLSSSLMIWQQLGCRDMSPILAQLKSCLQDARGRKKGLNWNFFFF